jgi:uncharacterized protein (TIRG00374 family)
LATSKSRKKPSWLYCVLGRSNITAEETVQTKKDWQRILPGLVVSLISLAIAFYFVDLRQLIQALRQANYVFVALSLVLSLAWLLARAAFWRTLLEDKATYSQSFFTICEGYLLNNILPFRLGEVGRSFLMSHKSGLSFWQVLSTVVIERAMDVGFAAGLLLISLPFVVGAGAQAGQQRNIAIIAGVVVLSGLVVLYVLARNRQWALDLFGRLAQRWPLLQRVGGSMLPAFFSGLAVLTDGWRFVRALSWLFLNWFFAILQFYLLLLAFVPEGKFIWSAFTLGVTAFGNAAPSSPGALGVYEVAVLFALSVVGVNSSVALAYAITAHLMGYLVNGLLGAFALGKDGESLTDLYARVRQISLKQDR